MWRKILSVLIACIIFISGAACFAEESESSDKTLSWWDAIVSALNEPEPDREPIYDSLDDKACTAAYIEAEYAFRDILKDAKTDIYSIYFIVACAAAREIEDTLYNSDSDRYQKVGEKNINYLLNPYWERISIQNLIHLRKV